MIKGFSEVYWFMVYWFIRIYINYRISSALSCVPWIDTGWQTHIRCLIFTGRFPPNSPIISGSFEKMSPIISGSFEKMKYELKHPVHLRHSVLLQCLSRAHMAVDETTALCACRGHTWQYTATHCNTLQHTATRCNTLQHAATHCNTLAEKMKRLHRVPVEGTHDRADEQASALICDCYAHHIYIYKYIYIYMYVYMYKYIYICIYLCIYRNMPPHFVRSYHLAAILCLWRKIAYTNIWRRNLKSLTMGWLRLVGSSKK